MKVYLVRHSESVGNSQKIAQGQSQGKLSDEGLRQAEEISEKLRGEKIDVVYSSDLGRCRETLEPFLKISKLKPVYSKELREINYGSLQGKKIFSVGMWYLMKKIFNPFTSFVNFRFPKGESLSEMNARSVDFFKKIVKDKKKKKILIVSHAGPISAIKSYLKGEDITSPMQYRTTKNSEIFVFEINHS